MAVKNQLITKRFAIYNGDCCEVLRDLPDESIGFSIFSPPFADLYSYSDDQRDMSNAANYEEFFQHFEFLVKQLHRLIMPGRVIAVHCMDLPTFKSHGEDIGVRDFPGDLIRCFEKCDFIQHSPRITIWKDPLLQATRTRAIGLAHKQLIKDSAMSNTGIPDCILAFRKKGTNPVPIAHPMGLTKYYGSRKVPMELEKWVGHEGAQNINKRSHWIWQQYASPVWFDIRQTRVLKYREGRDKDDEKHICVARNSLVLTKERGYVPIQDVQIGEHSLTHLGNWKPVVAVKCNGTQSVIQVHAQGVPSLIVTPTHRLWVRKSNRVREREGAEYVDPKWLEAEQCLSSYVNLPLPKCEEKQSTNSTDWWIVGRWLADGHWDCRDTLNISCGNHEIEYLKERLGDIAGVIHHTGTSYQIRLKDRDRRLRDIIDKCGYMASGKKLPPEAFTLPKAESKELLEGYLSGDGHFLAERQRWMASSVSKGLLLGMAVLAHRAFGAIASVYAGREEREDVIEGRIVHCQQDWIFSFDIPSEERYKTPFILPDGAWKKVRSIEDVGEAEVWDLQVADDESFTVEGCVVHNCPLQLDTIERCMELWSTEGDRVLTPYMGVGSEVFVAVKNKRLGVGVELKPSYYRQAVSNLRMLKEREKARLA